MHKQSGRFFYRNQTTPIVTTAFVRLKGLLPTKQKVLVDLLGHDTPGLSQGYVEFHAKIANPDIQVPEFDFIQEFKPLPQHGDTILDNGIPIGKASSVQYDWRTGALSFDVGVAGAYYGSVSSFVHSPYTVDLTPPVSNQPGPTTQSFAQALPSILGGAITQEQVEAASKSIRDACGAKVRECICDSFVLARSGHEAHCPYILNKRSK